MVLIAHICIVIGWGWNSGQSSPTSSKAFKNLVVIRRAGAGAAAAAAAAGVTSGTGHVEDKVDSPTGEKRRHTSHLFIILLLTDCPQPVHTFILYFSEILYILIILPYMHVSSSSLAIEISDQNFVHISWFLLASYPIASDVFITTVTMLLLLKPKSWQCVNSCLQAGTRNDPVFDLLIKS
jgi:hypothetical protein